MHSALKALFGARRVAGIEFLMHAGYSGDELSRRLARLGYNPATVLAQPAGEPAGQQRPNVYIENTRAERSQALRALLVKEALAYGLVCAETGFVAVRAEDGKLIEGTVAVGSALPHCWSDDMSGMLSMLAPVQDMSPRRSRSSGTGVARRGLARKVSPSLADAAATPLPSAPPTSSPPPSSPASIPSPAAPRGLWAKLSGLVGDAAPRQTLRMHHSLDSTEAEITAQSIVLFSGVPVMQEGEALLFDSSRNEDESKLASSVTISRLLLTFPEGTPQPETVDAALTLLIYVEDLAAPRAKIRLVDMLRQGGQRPLNLARSAGQLVCIVLVDASGAWAKEPLPFVLALQT